MRSGYYSRLEWPDPGGAFKQVDYVIDIFRLILMEESRIHAEELSHG